MVETQPSRSNMSQQKWKRVKFQATLIDSGNTARLYCAAVPSSSSLHMELCDQNSMERSSKEEERASMVFLYDPSTGEVVPSPRYASSSAGVEDTDGDGDHKQAIDRALAEALASSPPDKRQDKGDLRAIKLVFFLDQAEQTTNASHAISTGSTENDTQTPPLLRPA